MLSSVIPSPLSKKQISIFILIMLSFSCVFSQKILPDTFYVDFRKDTLIELKNICIENIVDKRDEEPAFVRYESKNKFLLIPVDQEIYCKHPLAEELLSTTECDSTDRKFSIEIEKFAIEKHKGKLRSSTYLTADLPVYEKVRDTLLYRGTLYYDFYYIPEARKESVTVSTGNLLNDWHTDFKLDLLRLRADSLSLLDQEYSNFIPDKTVRSLYLNCPVSVFAGYKWWGFQGEVFFTRPETNSRSEYTAGIFRYQNNRDYESFAIGKQAKHTIFRRNTDWLFDVDLNFLLGFCKWKDVDTEKPTLYQLFDMELSSVQSIVFNPLNKRGLIFRLGIIENINYVIEKDIEFQAGLMLGIGLKL